MKVALVTGFTGQDGTLLTDLLLKKGYQVIGLVRRVSTEPPRRVRGSFDFHWYLTMNQLVLHPGDLSSVVSLIDVLTKYNVDEIYNLAAQSHVKTSFEMPDYTTMVDYVGLMNLVTAMDVTKCQAKLYQASSSEMFGTDVKGAITEQTPFNPNSPYAIAKTAAHYYARSLRAQGRFVCAGILFNHESEVRGGDFVTQKIARAAVTDELLELGNVTSRRDWGHAQDYVRAMYDMMQNDVPREFVIGTGEDHSVKEFLETAYTYAGKTLVWDEGLGYVGERLAVRTNSRAFTRPLDVSRLLADPSRAKAELGWEPEIDFTELVHKMVDAQKESHAYDH